MKMIKLDSAVDVACDFCSRIGKRGYILADDLCGRPRKEGYLRPGVSGLEILCPACFTFLYGEGGWKPGEAWEEAEVSWKHKDNCFVVKEVSMEEFKGVYPPGDKNER
jgi:hypothetical protein